MAPQTSIPPVANVLGTIGTSNCWCVQLIPQIWRNWRRKSTEGLPGTMVMLWSACAVPFGVYAIAQNFNIPLQVQPQCFGLFCLICWGQTLVYHSGWRTWTATLITGFIAIVFGVVELILVLTLRGPYKRGVEWPLTMLAIFASVILALGLIPPYFELAKRSGRVIGIDFIFLTVDWSGAFFSLMALVTQNTFDWLGGSLYIVCLTLESGIFISQIIWLYRTRHVRRAAKKLGLTYDEFMKTNASKPEDRLDTAASADTHDDYPGDNYETVCEAIARPEKCKVNPSVDSSDSLRRDILDLEKGLGSVQSKEDPIIPRDVGHV